MTRGQALGVLAIGVVAGLAALVSLVSGVLALFDSGLLAAIPALIMAPLVLGFVSYKAIQFAGPALASPQPASTDGQSREDFIRRAQSQRPPTQRRR